MSPYSRRDALRAGLGAIGLSLAGCLTAPRSGTGAGDGTTGETTTATRTTTGTPPPKPTLLMRRVPTADVKADAEVVFFSATLRGWLERAIENGAVDLPDGTPPNLSVERAEYVRYGGDYYDVSTERVTSESSHELRLGEATGSVGSDAAVVAFEELSADEQKVVRDARRDEARVGFHEAYDGQYDFAARYDYLAYEGHHYPLSLKEETRTEPHRVLRIESAERSTMAADSTVFELEYVEIPDEDRSAVASAMRTGSATAEEFSSVLIGTVERADYVAGPAAIYEASIRGTE